MIRRTCLLMAGSVVVVNVLGTLSACSAGQPRFTQMSGEQLHSYNWNKPFAEQVSCQKLQTANSRIPRRRCLSNASWASYYQSGFDKVNAMQRSDGRN